MSFREKYESRVKDVNEESLSSLARHENSAGNEHI